MRASYTAIVERNVTVEGAWSSEPYECGWASEAIFFVRVLDGELTGVKMQAEISPDGMHWCADACGLTIPIRGEAAFVKVKHFGNWLRLCTDTEGKTGKVLVTLSLKE